MLERPQIGKPAPAIELARHDPDHTNGGRWSLADHAGQVVVVTFHRHIH